MNNSYYGFSPISSPYESGSSYGASYGSNSGSNSGLVSFGNYANSDKSPSYEYSTYYGTMSGPNGTTVNFNCKQANLSCGNSLIF